MKQFTPIVSLGDIDGNHISIKRDDLLPFSFGGNKVRIAQEYFTDMEQKGCDYLIGYGNARSNLCRVLANMSASRNIPCTIISPNDDDGTRVFTMNSKMVEICGAEIVTCQKDCVAETVQDVIDRCRENGYNPYYIYGDKYGKGNEAVPVRAYAKVFHEILEQSEKPYDTIFLPTGTGMTHSGLLAGAVEANVKQEIVGISVARSAEQEKQVLENYLSAYLADKNIADEVHNPINITDKYLFGGYGKYNAKIRETIETVYRNYGFQLDPTYTAKGFYGMLQWLKSNEISGKNILYIHTGGSPLFFDFLGQFIIKRGDSL
ncbi:MAG: pyridoxal-phosphate dependent enzyme [Ruminococcus flavefaciens]|nr:pyridoxal-phosphate dependent enzyme [Ruminococcus flavefaciens]MCM1230529.1 pyridoxal-phosphate dependent enzyme [Ruminococcus flavefaciens]